MDAELRRAWTEIVTPEDYDAHMAAIGQAQAGAALARYLIEAAQVPAGGRIVLAGAGTGQMFDWIPPSVFRPFRLVCTDLSARFLQQLGSRLARLGLEAALLVDDIEQTALEAGPGLLLATLLLEHIDWRCGVRAIAALGPAACGFILQENPPGMQSAVTPGRPLPPSIAQALETAHPRLVPLDDLQGCMEMHGYALADLHSREVADGKRLVAMLFR